VQIVIPDRKRDAGARWSSGRLFEIYVHFICPRSFNWNWLLLGHIKQA
jgi:hypothetical protein